MNIGSVIKKLRLDKKLTQEELAKKLNVSFQAVSKWETGTTTPDIYILPKIAVFFSVSMDELFQMNADDYLNKISNMIRDDYNIDDSNFSWAKRYLNGLLLEDENNINARTLLIELHGHRENRDSLTQGRLCEDGLLFDPSDVCLHGNLTRVRIRRGEIERLSQFYDKLIQKNPQNEVVYHMMINALIQGQKYDKAKEYINKLEKTIEQSIFICDVEIARGSIDKTIDLLDDLYRKNLDNIEIIEKIADRYNKIEIYEKAILLYEKSFALQESPKKLDALYALAFLYEKNNDANKAINSWEEIIAYLNSDYNITSGETIDWPLREIKRLKDNNL